MDPNIFIKNAEKKVSIDDKVSSISDSDDLSNVESSDDIDSNIDDDKDDNLDNVEQIDNEDEEDNEEEDNEDKDISEEYIEAEKQEYIISNEDDNEDDCLYQCDSIVQEKDIDIIPIEVKDKQTDNYITNYEKVRILGIRTQQILKGAKVMLKYDKINKLSAYDLAIYELDNKTTPLIIKRPLPNNTYELWKISDLLFINDNNNYINDINMLFKNNDSQYII